MRLPQIVRFDDVKRVNATALQRIGCRAVVPRQPHIIYSRIANAEEQVPNSNSEGPGELVYTFITLVYSALRTKRTEKPLPP